MSPSHMTILMDDPLHVRAEPDEEDIPHPQSALKVPFPLIPVSEGKSRYS